MVDLKTVSDNASFTFGKFLTGALVSAALGIGGVWFVVDQNLQSVRQSIDITNERIVELKKDMATGKDLQIVKLELMEQFAETQRAIKEASFVSPWKEGSQQVKGNEDPTIRMWPGTSIDTENDLKDWHVYVSPKGFTAYPGPNMMRDLVPEGSNTWTEEQKAEYLRHVKEAWRVIIAKMKAYKPPQEKTEPAD